MKKQSKKISDIFFPKAKTLAEGITSEEIKPVYLDLSRLKLQPEIIYRLDLNNYRYYYRFVNGVPVFYVSVTTMIKNTLPTPKALIKWIAEQDDYEEELAETSVYGTFLHQMCQTLLITGSYDLDKMEVEFNKMCERENIKPKQEWIKELKKDILAFAQFVIDHNVKPVAIEMVLYHPDGYAGALDIVCEMNIEERGYFGEVYASGANKGQPKETKQTITVNAIVDIKKGRKGFYESSEIQLAAYKEMWRVHFPDFEINRTYNFSPKAWIKNPSYNLKDQTNAPSQRKLPYLVELAKIEDNKMDKKVVVLSGKIEPSKSLDKNIKELTLSELVQNTNQ